MAGQITFYRKNHIDLQRPNPFITITDTVAVNNGQGAVDQMRNRDNVSGWLTTDSNDSANTEILVNLGDIYPVNFISLIKNNFKDYLVEYLTIGDTWETIVNVVSNTESTNVHILDTTLQTRAIRITIYATKIVDADKELRQLIITEKLYSFEGWPVIKKPTFDQNTNKDEMISGKMNVVRSRGGFRCELEIKLSVENGDLDIHQNLYDRVEGVLMLISGGDENQFRTLRKGYRNEDIVLVSPIDDYSNPYIKGIYTTGIDVGIKLAEVRD